MRKKALLFMSLGVILCPFASFAADESGETPIIVNTGDAYVAPNSSGTTMLIPKSIVLYGASNIYVAGTDADEGIAIPTYTTPGKISIGGSVYQSTDASTDGNGFSVDATGKASGKGVVSFSDVTDIKNNGSLNGTVGDGKKRYITAIGSGAYPATADINGFNRGARYVAFPKIEINTTDTIVVPGKMGIDANTITRPGAGIVRLKSEIVNESGSNNVYDASLRVVGTKTGNTGVSTDFVPLNAVWVERNVAPYRLAGTTANYQIGFAAPYDNLRSGYFAGNYVRSTQGNPGYTGYNPANIGYDTSTGHIDYVYANKKNTGTNKVDKMYYLVDPNDQFQPSVGYVLNLRPTGFDYQDLINEGGLGVTNPGGSGDADEYKRGLFVFGKTGVGGLYWMSAGSSTNEQLYAKDKLYTSPVLNVSSANTKYINWVIGNSYTSGIDISKLAAAMKSGTNFEFGSNIFVWPAGSTTYQPYPIANDVGGGVFSVISNLKEIPTQTSFILQLLPNKSQTGSFTIDKSMLTHGNKAHGTAFAQGDQYLEEVLFKVTPKENPNIYDLALIGFRAGAKEASDDIDLEKIYSKVSSAFQLYSTSSDKKKLSGNALNSGVASAVLAFAPASQGNTYVISASRLESLTTEIVWLEDLKAGKIIDLRGTDQYEFTSLPGDAPDRFVVHFAKSSVETSGTSNGLDITYDGNEQVVIVSGLNDTDKGSLVVVADAQGRIVRNATVNEIPQFTVPVHLVDGVYIATLKGNRNLSKKFIVKPAKY